MASHKWGGGIRAADEDTSANQTFDNSKIDKADSKTLSDILKSLPEKVENNSKVNSQMDALGDKAQVKDGEIKEITEFGGWTAIDNGKFAIAKQTKHKFFPIGTINVTRAQGKEGGKETAFVQESVLDTTNNYTLLLGKTVTGANRNEPAYNGVKYKSSGEGPQIARNVKGFNGIEKTFKAYSPETGSNVKVGFKIGYTGDIDGVKAKYKVVVLAHTEDGQWDVKYTKVVDPTKKFSKEDPAKVEPAHDGNVKELDVTGKTKDEAEKLIIDNNRKPNGKVGTFLIEDIQLPIGATEYKVQISIADPDRLGMSYQSKYELYALPISGADFNITQDTKQLAKSLFSKIYDKLIEEKNADTTKKTPESIAAYEESLNEMKKLIDSNDLKSAKEYVAELKKVEVKKEALVSTVLDLQIPNKPVEVENPAQLTAEEKGKVREAIKAANPTLKLEDADIDVKDNGEAVVTKGGKTATVPADKAVTQKLTVNPPKQAIEVENPAQLTAEEKGKVRE
ncbi:hypothetical protein, partial [Peptoniphilus vaginalis]|uniref:hypothetical protein n=1 Tax=Peptoniphilus vaginalis TaxID=1756987 RepID=UPI0023F6B41B